MPEIPSDAIGIFLFGAGCRTFCHILLLSFRAGASPEKSLRIFKTISGHEVEKLLNSAIVHFIGSAALDCEGFRHFQYGAESDFINQFRSLSRAAVIQEYGVYS